MNEIRFNTPNKNIQDQDVQGGQDRSSKNKKNIFWRKNVFKSFFIFTATILMLIFVGFITFDYFKGRFAGNSEPVAVFLLNGQVYFGRVIKNNSEEIILRNVYYLQAEEKTAASTGLGQASSTVPKVSLVKLGNEVHKPTDEIHINKAQVMFYEKLQADSKVSQAILKTNK